MNRAEIAERHKRIARAVKNQPSRTITQISKDFGVSRKVVYRACKAHKLPTSKRPARKWGDKTITESSWLHPGDILMSYCEDNRQVRILKVAYHEDFTVSYLCENVSDFRRKHTRFIHERTVKRSYVRIHTSEQRLPDERFLEWTFGPSN